MNRVALLVTTILFLSACGPPPALESGAGSVTFFEGGRAILGNGTEPIEDVAFVVEEGIITAIGPVGEIEHPAGAERFDLSDHTALPFLHNLHGHVGYIDGTNFSAENYSRENVLEDLDRYLYYGVGSVAVLGSDVGDIAFQIREEQRNGQLETVRLLTAGRGVTGRNGFPTRIEALADVPQQVGTEEEAREAVRELAAQGVDFVKVWVDDDRRVTGQVYRGGRLANNYSTTPKLSPALYGAVIDEAHQNNIRVVAHVRYLADAKSLVAAGIDGLVHSIRDRSVDDALIEAMLENDVFYVPTLTNHQAAFVYADEPDWLGENFMRESVSGAVIGRLSSRGIVGALRQDPNLPGWRREFETAMENFKTLFDAGVTVGLGTDSGVENRFAGYFEHREMELMVEAGVTPLEAITIGTQGTARIMRLEDTGTLEVGMRGDFIIVPGRPLDDITATRNIAEVFRSGEQVERSTMMLRFTN